MRRKKKNVAGGVCWGSDFLFFLFFLCGFPVNKLYMLDERDIF